MNWKILLALPLLAMFTGCASPEDKVESTETETDSLLIEEIMPLLPSPGEFLDMVHNTGMVYQEDLINPIVDPNNFVLYRNQALTFGVYLTDFSYLLLFEKQTESIRYLYHIQEMAKKLEVEAYFDDEFFNKILANLSNPDSLQAISLQQSTLFFNRMNAIGNKDLAFLISTGSIIEGMYIASKAIDEKQLGEEVFNRTIDLSYLFDTYYLHFTISKPNEPAFEKLANDIQELRKIFTSMSIAQTSRAIRNEGDIILKSEVTHDINKHNISKMKVMVDSIRQSIVNQKY
ncbi:MAG: hypothetical protein ACLFNU_09130 [Bacteroidales bacterium]